MSNVRQDMHTHSIEKSLVLPSNATLKVYDIGSWDFSPLVDKGNGLFFIAADCNLDGFENVHKEWNLVEKDLQTFGNGDPNQLRQYVVGSFDNTLQILKEKYLNRIKNAMGNAFGGS